MDVPWWRRAVIYQVYVRSFRDTNGDGIGDLPGIIESLDHLAWLGVDAVWLTPFFRSAHRDLGYDVVDYCAVDPLHGTLDDFDRLVAAAHQRNIRVILDLVVNHTSVDHPWFVESRRSRSSPLRDWYWWRPGDRHGGPPNNWRGQVNGEPGGAWAYDPGTAEWYLANFSPTQPELNWANPEVRAAVREVVRFWTDRGVDGFRVDMADFLGKDPALTDEPHHDGLSPRQRIALARHQLNRPESLRYLRELRSAMPDGRVVIAELIYRASIPTLVRWARDGAADLPMNFRLTYLRFDAATLTEFIRDYDAACAEAGTWPNYCLGNHDCPRSARLGANHRAALVLLLTLRGTPFLYYGDELGMPDVDVPPEDRQDLWEAGSRDGCRTPMRWHAGPGHGFTTPQTRPWLPFGSVSAEDTVAGQRTDPGSTLHLVQRLLRLRATTPALVDGDQTVLNDLPADVLGLRRRHRSGEVTVLINLGAGPVEALPGDLGLGPDVRLLLSTNPDARPPATAGWSLAAGEAAVLRG